MTQFGYKVLGFGSGSGVKMVEVDYLVVAGGGGGGDGGGSGGGGGAGGFRTSFPGGTKIEIPSGESQTVTVGGGGAHDNSGSNTEIGASGSIIASTGGGRGGGGGTGADAVPGTALSPRASWRTR